MIDRTDLRLLQALQDNARLTNKELAAAVHLSPTPTYDRWRRLEREGYITGYRAIIDPGKIHQGFLVFTSVKLARLNTDVARDFTERVAQMPQVTECYNISGNFDYLLKVHSHDMADYRRFLLDDLGRIDSVAAIESTFVMDETKNCHGINIITETE